MTKASRRSARATGQRDGFEESDDSDSDDSAPDSPAIPAYLLQQGTRSRNLRNAALTASAGIRSNLSGLATVRSATPESVAPSHHEGRSSARRRDYKEESDDESAPEKLIVVLKLGRARLREWTRSQRVKDRAAVVSNVSSQGSPRPGTHSRSVSAAPLNLAAMPPPPSPVPPPADIPGAVEATHHPPSAAHPAVSICPQNHSPYADKICSAPTARLAGPRIGPVA
jgi:SWI/SNF-related matrix-associated actin-dependent regulator of chromatin subfamily B protein 1